MKARRPAVRDRSGAISFRKVPVLSFEEIKEDIDDLSSFEKQLGRHKARVLRFTTQSEYVGLVR